MLYSFPILRLLAAFPVHLQGSACQNAIAYFKNVLFFSFFLSFMLTCCLVSFIVSLSLKVVIFFNFLLVGSLLPQDCHISYRNQILACCFGIFLINTSVIFSLPSMTSSADVIFGLVAPRNGRGWI